MRQRVLKIDLYQPFAHYRSPNVKEDSYVSTLNIPTPTTIVGMLSYVCDIRFDELINIGIITKFEFKDVHFIRGEAEAFWDEYNKKIKKYKNDEIYDGKRYVFFKKHEIKNRIMNIEVLREVQHTVFIKCSEKLMNVIKESINNPKRYISLGRKEDFAILGIKKKSENYNYYIQNTLARFVEIDEMNVEKVETSIQNDILIKNSYIKIDLKDEHLDDILLRSGRLIGLPYRYANLKEDKRDRKLIYGHFIELREDGYYPKKLQINVYYDENKKQVFTWLVGEKNENFSQIYKNQG